MKITPEQIKQIKELYSELNIKKISIKLNIPYSTVRYHLNEDYRKDKIKKQLEYQKKNPPKRGDNYRNYQREYQKKRYWEKKNV
jgi:DNA-binding transcriptional ArsR family regulator